MSLQRQFNRHGFDIKEALRNLANRKTLSKASKPRHRSTYRAERRRYGVTSPYHDEFIGFEVRRPRILDIGSIAGLFRREAY